MSKWEDEQEEFKRKEKTKTKTNEVYTKVVNDDNTWGVIAKPKNL